MTTMTSFSTRAAALAFALIAASAASVSQAADAPPRPLTAQQNKMGICNKAAAGKTGGDRKAFMADCLKTKPVVARPTQQQKMTQCNRDAAGRKGDDRKAFMSGCLRAG